MLNAHFEFRSKRDGQLYLASYQHDGRDRVGAVVEETHLIDLSEAAQRIGASWPHATMHDLIAAGPEALDQAREIVAQASANDVTRTPTEEVTWHPPIIRPGKIIGVPLNNSASDARKISSPDHPMFFHKPTTCLLGHHQPIIARPHYGGFHPEPELGVVIGKLAKDVDPRTAMDFVFGYTIINDLTGNEMRASDQVHYWALYPKPDNPDEVERREQHLSYTARYKGSDGFGPTGPWIATKEEIPDPHVLDVKCSVKGEVYTQDSTANYTYRVEEIIAYISRYQTLEPGDLISMGTAFRASDTSRRPLHTANLARIGGPCEISISGIGTLTNPVAVDDSDPGDWRLPNKKSSS